MKIKCIGFSVTGFGKPNFPTSLKDKLKKFNDLDVKYMSIGGLSIDALSPLLKTEKEHCDILILEITTSWFSLRKKNEAEAEHYIRDIHHAAKILAKRVIYLNLYRKDICDKDIVVNAINKICRQDSIILNLKDIYRKRLLNFGHDGTVDGVHPTQETIEEIAQSCANEITNSKIPLRLIDCYPRENYRSMLLLNSIRNKNILFNNNHGLLLPAYKLAVPSSEILNFPINYLIDGIYFIYGPDTTSINLEISGDIINIQMFDENSFYRRLGYRFFNAHKASEIKIQTLPDRPNVELRKSPWESVEEKKIYIIGFSYICNEGL